VLGRVGAIVCRERVCVWGGGQIVACNTPSYGLITYDWYLWVANTIGVLLSK
jgi:hypothetical protein